MDPEYINTAFALPEPMTQEQIRRAALREDPAALAMMLSPLEEQQKAGLNLAHNRIAGSCQAPLLVAFTRHTGALGVTVNPYLVNSTFALALGGDVAWADAWYAHPDGLGNTLLVDGVLQPTGTRVAYDPARSCP